MSYRLPDKSCCDKNSYVNDFAKKSVISIDNGTISYITLPAFYEEPHNRSLHDHLGWPSPSSPDNSCQIPPGCNFILEDIDLTDEGYQSVEISMIDPPDGLSFTGSIFHNMVIFEISSMCQDAITSDIDVVFAAYVVGVIRNDYDEKDVPLRDVITKGVLHIIAGPIQQ